MPNDKLIGIDVGTTAIIAGVLDKSGTVFARFVESYPTKRTGTTVVEQDPDDWVRLIGKALSSFNENEIAAIGLCSQVNTHVFVDTEGKALCPAILWQDRRASDERGGQRKAIAHDARERCHQLTLRHPQVH